MPKTRAKGKANMAKGSTSQPKMAYEKLVDKLKEQKEKVKDNAVVEPSKKKGKTPKKVDKTPSSKPSSKQKKHGRKTVEGRILPCSGFWFQVPVYGFREQGYSVMRYEILAMC